MPLSVENLYKVAAEDAVDGRPLAARLLRPSGLPLAPRLTGESSKPAAKAKSDSSNPFGGPDYSAAKKNPFGGPEYGNSDNNNYSGALYGLGGAGAGALLGAAVGNKKNRMRNAALGGLLGGGTGLILNHLNNAPKTASHTEQLYSTLTAGTEKQADMQAIIAKLMPYLQQAREAGGNFLKSDIGRHALGGGAIGAGLGGLAGLVNPGEDEEGNSRSRFGAMLRGALGGGALGAGAGGALGYFAPNAAGQAYDAATTAGSNLARRLGYRGRSSTAVTPTTSGQSLSAQLPGSETVNNPLYKGPQFDPSKENPNIDVTRPPTDEAASRARKVIDAGVARDMAAQAERTRLGVLGQKAYDAEKSMPRQQLMDQAAGVAGVTPEVLSMKQNNPALFEQMMQAARDKQVESNLSTAPSMGFDASGLDTSNMQAPTSATLGR